MIEDHPASEGFDLTNCEKEPIHRPGRVQPFGVLLVLSDPDLKVRQASVNFADYFHQDMSLILGRSLDSIFSERELSLIRSRIAKSDFVDEIPLQVRSLASPHEEKYMAQIHRHKGKLILELERVETADIERRSFVYQRLSESIIKVQGCSRFQDLKQTMVSEIQSLTGFNGVMIYKFHEDGHGEVVAEAKSAIYDSYLGLHYPASDIPKQARAIFLQNWARMIPDANYQPVEIRPANDPDTGEAIDLSRSVLRSVSPIHIQYLHNMKVKASLTIPLIHQRKLWGLIACHHYDSPKFIPFDIRKACEVLGRVASSEMSLKIQNENLQSRDSLRQVRSDLQRVVEHESEFISQLFLEPIKLMNLVRASGSAAYLSGEERWLVAGEVPNERQLNFLLRWLNQRMKNKAAIATDHLSSIFPEASEYTNIASGLLVISIPKGESDFFIWFRPEVLRSVYWAGNPGKPVEAFTGGYDIQPRKSFDAWKETVKGRSVPWKPWEIDEVLEFRSAIMASALRKQVRKEQEARKQAELANRQKQDLLAVVSHDLRNPLSSVKLSLGLLRRLLPPDGIQRLESVLESIQRSVDFMNRLVGDLLSIAKIESGTFTIEREPNSVHSLFDQAYEILEPLALEKEVRLHFEKVPHDLQVISDRDRILQVLSNIIGNAIKFTPPGGKVEVHVKRKGGELVFAVADTGPGIPRDHLPFVFDKFWQAHQTQRKGAGLGLPISKGIVEAHAGHIWVESEPGKGSVFYFSLPRDGSKLEGERVTHEENPDHR